MLLLALPAVISKRVFGLIQQSPEGECSRKPDEITNSKTFSSGQRWGAFPKELGSDKQTLKTGVVINLFIKSSKLTLVFLEKFAFLLLGIRNDATT